MAYELKRKPRSTFSGSLGFILAAAGSAVGLGNIWRFPYLAARDGGGLFLVVYLALSLTFGFTLLITEVAIGRRSHQGPLTAYRFLNRKWGWLGYVAFIIPVIIYPYYCVIGGWVLRYLSLYLLSDGALAVQDGFFEGFITSQYSPIVFCGIFALMCFFVVYSGVQKGIEKMSRIVMPSLVLMVISICVYSMTIKYTDPVTGVTRTGLDGAAVYFIPDISNVTVTRFLSIALDATGQLFYSLSIAMGILITYGSYMKRDVNLGKAVDHIEVCDTLIAVLAGMMIIPSVYVFMGHEGMAASGPGLMFVALPKVFASLGDMGRVVAIVFFFMVFFAALTSAISILEACVSGVMDHMRWRRPKSVCTLATFGFLASVVVCLGYNAIYFELTLPNGVTAQILDVMDYITNNIMMPVLAISTCILTGWVCKPHLLVGEIRLNGYNFWRKRLYIVMLRFVVPVLLFILLLSAFGIY